MELDTTHETTKKIIQRCADAFGEPVYPYRLIYAATGDEWLLTRDGEVLATGTLAAIVEHIDTVLHPLLEQSRKGK